MSSKKKESVAAPIVDPNSDLADFYSKLRISAATLELQKNLAPEKKKKTKISVLEKAEREEEKERLKAEKEAVDMAVTQNSGPVRRRGMVGANLVAIAKSTESDTSDNRKGVGSSNDSKSPLRDDRGMPIRSVGGSGHAQPACLTQILEKAKANEKKYIKDSSLDKKRLLHSLFLSGIDAEEVIAIMNNPGDSDVQPHSEQPNSNNDKDIADKASKYLSRSNSSPINTKTSTTPTPKGQQHQQSDSLAQLVLKKTQGDEKLKKKLFAHITSPSHDSQHGVTLPQIALPSHYSKYITGGTLQDETYPSTHTAVSIAIHNHLTSPLRTEGMATSELDDISSVGSESLLPEVGTKTRSLGDDSSILGSQSKGTYIGSKTHLTMSPLDMVRYFGTDGKKDLFEQYRAMNRQRLIYSGLEATSAQYMSPMNLNSNDSAAQSRWCDDDLDLLSTVDDDLMVSQLHGYYSGSPSRLSSPIVRIGEKMSRGKANASWYEDAFTVSPEVLKKDDEEMSMLSAMETTGSTMFPSTNNNPMSSNSRVPKLDINLDDDLSSQHSPSTHFYAPTGIPKSIATNDDFSVLLQDDAAFNAGDDQSSNSLSTSSPRTIYLGGCIKEGLNPRSKLIIRKEFTTELALAHYGIGDEMGKILAECIHELPLIESIDLSDNSLTDASLKYLVDSMTRIPSLTHLNLSKNKIDGESSEALSNFVSRSDCPLVSLILQSADVDDGECYDFVAKLTTNKTLRVLDLSSNLLGLAVFGPTGGDALAEYLVSDCCQLNTLRLGWNSIKAASAVTLARSLAMNTTLTFLDLSYNGMGSAAGEALGDAIMTNKVLKTLVLTNNNLNSSACFTICVGVQENFAMKALVLNENPLGEMGVKALMQIPIICGNRVAIEAKNCNLTLRDGSCWFDYAFPCRSYVLNLEKEYERAVAFAVLGLVGAHPSYIFTETSYEQSPGSGKIDLQLIQSVGTDKEQFFDEQQRKVMKGLKATLLAANNQQEGMRLFHKADADQSGELDSEELIEVLQELGFDLDDKGLDDIFTVFDVDGAGTIGGDEFQALLKSLEKEASHRIKDMIEYPMITRKNNPKVKYIPPKTGILYLEVIDGFKKKEKEFLVSSCDQENAVKMAKSIGDVSLLAKALSNTKIRYAEALSMYKELYGSTGNQAESFASILPQIAYPSDARLLLSSITNDDRVKIAQISRAVGALYKPIFLGINGHYELNLSRELDRNCLTRLFEANMNMKAARAPRSSFMFGYGKVGDTSQAANWSYFRNGVYKGKGVDIKVEDFTPVPQSGIIEFDFVGALRPEVGDLVLSDERVVKVLVNLCLLKGDAETNQAISQLKTWRRKASAGEGSVANSQFECPLKTALEAGLARDDFYANLLERRMHLANSASREEIQVNYMIESSPTPDSTSAVNNSSPLGGGEREERDEERDDDGEGQVGDEDLGERTKKSSANNNKKVQKKDEQKKRIQALLDAKVGVSQEAKAVRLGEMIEEIFSRMLIRSRHLALIVKCFSPIGSVERIPYFGSYVVDLICGLFGRVVDLHNFELVMSQISGKDMGCLQCRLGMLNLWNPAKPEGSIELALFRREERLIAKMIMHLADVEPGINLPQKSFQWKREEDPMPGWEVTEPWLTEDGVPYRGICSFTYYSGENQGKRGCKPMKNTRYALMQMVLIDEEDEVVEENPLLVQRQSSSHVSHEAKEHFSKAKNKELWEQYLLPDKRLGGRCEVWGEFR